MMIEHRLLSARIVELLLTWIRSTRSSRFAMLVTADRHFLLSDLGLLDVQQQT